MPIPTKTINLEHLPAALDLAAFVQVKNGFYRPIGQMPEWLPLTEETIELGDQFPILEMFFAELDEETWKGASDIWLERDPRGRELYLQAVATTLDDSRLIIIRPLPEDLQRLQQRGNDSEILRDRIEKLSKELEIKRREAERATQAKSDFLATMSHEIRTPLNAIIGMADVLSATPLTAEQKRCVDVFQRNGVALLTLINDILDLSKVEAGRVELEAADFDLQDVVNRAMEVVEGRASAKGLSLRRVLSAQVPSFLVGDPNRLRQIIINLLGNSIKFTDKGGLTVGVEQDPEDPVPGHLRFAITDTGIGIPKDRVNAIFESFTQVDASTTRKYGGTGLGLTISKQLVELMGGRIWVESELGVGSTFYFTAKLKPQQNQSQTHTEQAKATSTADLEKLLAGLRILLADDSEDNRFLILSYLKRANAIIEIAENGEIAARKFREGHYDVVLMDVEMPVMDGSQATREIRAFEKQTGAAATPVLALTAHAFADMAVKGAEAGFTALLTKPVRAATLLEALAFHGKRRDQPPPSAAPPEPEVEHPLPTEKAAIRVQVEEGMEDVVPGYLEKRKAEVKLYEQALGASDFDTIKKMAHKMKGTGSGYGLPKLTELGSAMDLAALNKDEATLHARVAEFSTYVQAVELEYSK